MYCPRGSPRTCNAMAACFFQLTVARKQSVRRFVLLRSDGQTANRLIHFSFCLLHRIYYRNHGYIGRNTAGAVQGEGRADVQHRRGQGACRLCVGVGRYPGYLAALLSVEPPYLCFEILASGCDRLAERGGPSPPCPATHCHGSSLSYKFLSSLLSFHLVSFLNTHPLCFCLSFPNNNNATQCRPWPTPSAPRWDPAGWTS